MAEFLFDECLPGQIAIGLRVCGLSMYAVGEGDAPPRTSSDARVVQWCLDRRCVLVTEDRGKKNREILELFRRYTSLHVILVSQKLHQSDGFLFAWMRHHRRFEEEVKRRTTKGGCFRVRLTAQGGISDFKLP